MEIKHQIEHQPRAIENVHWFVGYIDGKEIGRVGATLIDQFKPRWLFHGGFVEPDYRGNGYFRELWDARLAFVKSQRARSIVGWSGLGNRKIFIEAGFEEIGRDPGFPDELEMELWLIPRPAVSPETSR